LWIGDVFGAQRRIADQAGTTLLAKDNTGTVFMLTVGTGLHKETPGA
jgi:hypothetical protein